MVLFFQPKSWNHCRFVCVNNTPAMGGQVCPLPQSTIIVVILFVFQQNVEIVLNVSIVIIWGGGGPLSSKYTYTCSRLMKY